LYKFFSPFLRCRSPCGATRPTVSTGAGNDHIELAFVTAIPNPPPVCSANKPSFSGSSALPVVISFCAHLRSATWESHGMGIANCVHSIHRVSFLFSFPRSIPVQLPPGRVQLPPWSFVQYVNKRYYTGFDSQMSTEEGLGSRYSKFILYRSHPVRHPVSVRYGRGSALSIWLWSLWG